VLTPEWNPAVGKKISRLCLDVKTVLDTTPFVPSTWVVQERNEPQDHSSGRLRVLLILTLRVYDFLVSLAGRSSRCHV
jgi:hypothetical protein